MKKIEIETNTQVQLEEFARRWVAICLQQIQHKQKKLKGDENGKPKKD